VSTMTGPQGFGPDTGYRSGRCKREMAAYHLVMDGGRRVDERVCTDCLEHAGRPRFADRMDSIVPLCDFCSLRWYGGELATLHADAQAVPLAATGDVMMQTPEWAVCPECRPFIEARDLTGLIARVTAIAVEYLMDNVDPAHVAAFRDLFRYECRAQYAPLFKTMRLPLDPPGSGEEGQPK
jgi:hypothetical protein